MSKLIATSQLTLMNLTERAETRRETFYKLTNSADIPEVPSGNRNLILYSADPWQAPSGYYSGYNAAKTSETYNGAVVYKTGTAAWSRLGINLGKHLVERGVVKIGDKLIYSVFAKTDQETPIKITLYVRYKGSSAAEELNGKPHEFTLTKDWRKISIPFTVTEKMVSEETRVNYLAFEQTTQSESGKYVYYACNKIERGSVATPYRQAPEDLGWSTDTLVPTKTQRYLWKFEYIYYSDGSVEIAGPVNLSIAGQDADATEAINKTKQELLEKLVTVRDESLAAAEEAKQGLTNVNTKVDNAKAELTQAKQQLTTVADDLSQAKTDLQNAVSAVDTKATNLKSDLTQAKQDLTSQAQQLQAQASAQSELTKRVSSVEKTANSTKTTVSELSKTVAQNGKDITSVTARTKVVEDDLAGTKTTLSQVKTTADSTSQKTATLETGLNGLSAKFNSLSVGGVNLIKQSTAKAGVRLSANGRELQDQAHSLSDWIKIEPNTTYTLTTYENVDEGGMYYSLAWYSTNNADYSGWISRPTGTATAADLKGGRQYTSPANATYAKVSYPIKYPKVKLERGNISTDYNPSEVDLEQKVAEYKQNADQNYASLQTTVQNLDGTVQHNKTVADQTAQGFTTRIESLETYKNGESERANAYFESAKTETAKQLTAERTAIAKDYVAKSTYTSDVTGIRNELSATTSTANTTKTNLANYQASNDKMVASLKSSLQTTDGNVSNLQTKVEAVPGQITSAVSAVEGKIPTEIGAKNLIIKSTAKTGVRLSADGKQYQDQAHSLSDWIKIEPNTTYTLTTYEDVNEGRMYYSLAWYSTNNADYSGWISRPTGTATSADLKGGKQYQAPANAKYAKVSYPTKYSKVKLERGKISTDYTSAPEDTAEQISSLSSQIKQTADGMTLLATKTELNTAKNELQSGINTATNKANSAQSTANNNAQTISTHTNQISALNTGLQAKVSQTDFNTLSGRVTTAENNITAKANELSSKITSVEGKIPTSIGARNYIRNYGLTATGWTSLISGWKFEIISDSTAKSGQYLKATCTKEGRNGFVKSLFDFSDGRFFDKQMTWAMDVKLSKAKSVRIGPEWGRAYIDINATTEWKRYSKTFTVATTSEYNNWVFYTNDKNWNVGDIVYIRDVQLEDGSIATSPVPAIEDAQSDIAKLSSEIKQTADGITLLATKTELNNTKNELQSGINTATNKANSAQSTANNNAQTISTHTNQISALNTGLQAKVSQTEFNTLSGRVTTAENNITAKANELSSKITSVEGKIPTSIGGRNLWIQSKATGGFVEETLPDNHITGQKKCYRIPNKQQLKFNIEPDFSSRLYRKVTFSAWVKYENVVQGDNSWNKFNCFKHELYRKNSSTGATADKNHLTLEDFVGTSDWKYITYTYDYAADKSYDQLKTSIRFNLESARSGTAWITGIKIEIGSIPSDYSPAPEDTINQISSLSSEFKQTTDSIKASVQSLDNNTVKSSSLTINSDGIVMKAGKSTTDVANAIGSYFAVNQNAIDLFADKIKVKGSMIVDGAITGDKIKASSVDVSKIVGIDANFIKSKIEHAMIDWLKGKTITAYNDNMTIDLQNGRISFKDGTNAVYRQTSDGIHTGFLHFEAGSLGGIYAAFGTTSTRQGINSKSSEFAGIRCYRVSKDGDSHDAKIDKIEVIGDTVQFGHGYRSDGSIGGGFIMDTAAYANETPYSLNRVVKSIESLWRILHDHAKNTGYRFNDPAFINALNNEYNAWHDMHND